MNGTTSNATNHEANHEAFDTSLTDEWFEGAELEELLLASDDDDEPTMDGPGDRAMYASRTIAKTIRPLVAGDAVQMAESALDYDPSWMALVVRVRPGGGVWVQPLSGDRSMYMDSDELVRLEVGTLR